MSKNLLPWLAAAVAALPLAAAQAQAPKPTARPVARPAARPAAPAPKPTPASKPAPAAPARPVAAPARPATPPPAPARPAARAAAADGPFAVGDNVVNLGIGLGSRYGYGVGLLGGSSSVSPAFSLSYERGVVALGPGILGIGGFVGYQGASYDLGGSGQWHYTDVVVMVRGAWHYPVTPQFDAYGGLGLGLRHSGESYDGKYASSVSPSSYNYFSSGLFVGGRYYFSPSFGGFAEVGYDQSFLKVGLAAKF